MSEGDHQVLYERTTYQGHEIKDLREKKLDAAIFKSYKLDHADDHREMKEEAEADREWRRRVVLALTVTAITSMVTMIAVVLAFALSLWGA